MATYRPIVCTNPTVVVYLCFSLYLSRWQIYARQLWVLSSQLTSPDGDHSPPSPSALYLVVFPVCKLPLPRLILYSYWAIWQPARGNAVTEALEIICTVWQMVPKCVLLNHPEQLHVAVYRNEGDGSVSPWACLCHSGENFAACSALNESREWNCAAAPLPATRRAGLNKQHVGKRVVDFEFPRRLARIWSRKGFPLGVGRKRGESKVGFERSAAVWMCLTD